ncbi:hypothetical protein E6H36_01175 [Candidatus Bathyarchaeota archaeon]|nr:MAG: hypothetical protein E6H36_01175 [Candidatus Bathyarchaeota archaeon]
MENLAARRDYRKPILFLFLLSPAVGELLSGASPPLAFFNQSAWFFSHRSTEAVPYWFETMRDAGEKAGARYCC